MQTDLIDLKTGGVDVYDLDTQRSSAVQKSRRNVGLVEKVDGATNTESNNKRLIAPKDWYYSDLHRRLLSDYYT